MPISKADAMKLAPLIRKAGEVGFTETVKNLEGKSEIDDPERLAGWLKARAMERGELAPEHDQSKGKKGKGKKRRGKRGKGKGCSGYGCK